MRLSELIAALPEALAPTRNTQADDPDPLIRGITYDSRQVAPGDLFFALPGSVYDGHAYLGQALDLGAAAVVLQDVPEGLSLRGRRAVVVPDARRALGPIANRFYGSPAKELRLVGVTGTNGKTSTSYLLESIFAAHGKQVGLIGTVEVRFGTERRRATNTTPESLDLQKSLRDMRTQGIDTCVMEVSSHGLELGRVAGCEFAVAAFTNLTQDHLDFHGDMATYRDAKRRLFAEHLVAGGTAVLNLDDPASSEFAASAKARGARCLGVSRKDPQADVRLVSADIAIEGTHASLELPDGTIELTLPLLGDFNLENLLVAVGVAVALGVPHAAIIQGVAECPQVPGRTERIGADIAHAPTVLVDYAHTPDAVEKLLATLRPLAAEKLVAVFGCGGDRDRAKRAPMAEAVRRHADRIVATSDNPRTEDPERILDDVEAGLEGLARLDREAFGAGRPGYLRLVDRREAIEAAIEVAGPNDTVVIAGKGHEDYQIIGREMLPFSDPEEALRVLRRRAGEAAG
jgi:UDP-N-acetylmuramoyl-L-alanyl-D-glutamate--2,6-diaminopimelate ligase